MFVVNVTEDIKECLIPKFQDSVDNIYLRVMLKQHLHQMVVKTYQQVNIDQTQWHYRHR